MCCSSLPELQIRVDRSQLQQVAVLAPQLGSVESRTSGWGLNTKERRDLHMKLASALKVLNLHFEILCEELSLFKHLSQVS